MTRDEIYDHLANVYLGKREGAAQKRKKIQVNQSWMVINIVITTVLVLSTVYGFTAFLTRRAGLNTQVYYELNNNLIKVNYDLNDPFPSTKTFAITLPEKDASKYSKMNLKIRGLNGGYPGVVKLVVNNQRNERATYYIKDVGAQWMDVAIPFEKLNLSDWSQMTEVAFVLEAWNVDFKQGAMLVDQVSFSN